ncbi:putative disease resistance protein At3g14460 [Telopea speciosissima]|uniref:putative disease resistance protein At3g14460 n=1 Tax=Telopea speciosissima TaxID=54955 RepID=UPI001CC34840|nr:putative disease resistance protein At3g14460 [Telopea speciosissima]
MYSLNELQMMVGLQHLTSLRRLVIDRCPKLLSLLDNDVEVGLRGGVGEGVLVLPSCIEYMELSYCDSLKKRPQSLCNLHCLKDAMIEGAVGLTCLPKGLDKLTSLQTMTISKCPNLVSLAERKLPIGLQSFSIEDCHNLESLPEELDKLTSLQIMRISKCPNLVSLAEMKLPIELQSLSIKECLALESFPDMGLPTTLVNLFIEKCGKLNSLPQGLHKLRNLEALYIMECSFLMDCKHLEPLCSLGLQNLTSLKSVTIVGCPDLVSILKGLLPTNLEYFYITDCPILESLHDGLSDLNSLNHLSIINCPILAQRYQQKKGDEWSKIAQIPDVQIDGRRQYFNEVNDVGEENDIDEENDKM